MSQELTLQDAMLLSKVALVVTLGGFAAFLGYTFNEGGKKEFSTAGISITDAAKATANDTDIVDAVNEAFAEAKDGKELIFVKLGNLNCTISPQKPFGGTTRKFMMCVPRQ